MSSKGLLLLQRDFGIYWSSHLVATTGTWFWRTVAPIVLYRSTEDPVLLGIFSVMSYGPVILVSFLGGILADRFDKRDLASLFQTLIIVLFFGLAVLDYLNHVSTNIILVAALVESVCYALAKPSVQAVLYDVVDPQDLGRAVPLNTSQYSIAQIVGPVLAIAILSQWGLAAALGVAGCLYLPIVVSMQIWTPGPRPDEPSIQETKSTVAKANRLKIGRSSGLGVLAVYLLSVAVGSISVEGSVRVLAPVIAQDLTADPGNSGVLISGHAVGGIIGIAIVLYGRRLWTENSLYRLGFAGFAVSILGFSVLDNFQYAVIFAALIGTMNAVSFNIATTLIHRNSTQRNRGRAMSLHNIALLGTRPIAGIMTGGLAARFGWSTAVRFFAITALIPLVIDLLRPNRTEAVQ